MPGLWGVLGRGVLEVSSAVGDRVTKGILISDGVNLSLFLTAGLVEVGIVGPWCPRRDEGA